MATTIKPTAEHFEYLDALRESGETNMFGAGAYLQDAFGIDKAEARAVLGSWMKTFDGKSSATERAAKAQGDR